MVTSARRILRDLADPLTPSLIQWSRINLDLTEEEIRADLDYGRD